LLWDSALLSLLVRFANFDIRITILLIPPGEFWCLPLYSCRGSSDPDPGPRVPFLIQGRPRVLWHNSCGQQFSCGVIDIAFAMSRRVFLPRSAPPSVSFFLNFYDVTLPDFD